MNEKVDTLEDLKLQHFQKSLKVGELCYRRQMDQEMIDELVGEMKAIHQKAAPLLKETEKKDE